MYLPVLGSSGKYNEAPKPANVQAACEMFETVKLEPDAKAMKALIKFCGQMAYLPGKWTLSRDDIMAKIDTCEAPARRTRTS